MDDQLREIQREAASGDAASRRRLDELTIRIGGTPSWDYLLEEQERVEELFKDHLRKAVEADLLRVFEKHGEVIQAVFWISTHAWGVEVDQWERFGLEVHVPDKYYLQKIYFRDNPGQSIYEARRIHHHLTTGECDCKGVCYININLGPSDHRNALANLLVDLAEVYRKLDKSPRWFGDQSRCYKFTLEKGLEAV